MCRVAVVVIAIAGACRQPGPAATPPAATRPPVDASAELLAGMRETGALYLIEDGRCAEWAVTDDDGHLALTREVTAPVQPMQDDAKTFRYHEARLVAVDGSMVSIGPVSSGGIEERDAVTGEWRGAGSWVGGPLCVDESAPRSVQRVTPRLAYVVDRVPVFLSRRACQESLAWQAPRLARCEQPR